ncbi:MAG: hypothetical protein WDM80_14535 [Limisphaerales bacterium]
MATACLLFCGSAVQAQSSITGVYPNGANMFQPSSTLSFTASSPAGVTNVTVQLTVTSLYSGQSFLKNLASGNGLTITGPNTGLSVSATLSSNTLYSAVIQVKDANGSVASQTVKFDTITPSYTWEAEDYNYGGGLFIDNPQTNAYAGLVANAGDAQNSNGGASYRPINPGLSTEGIGSPETSYKRVQYLTGQQDYDVGFTDGGDYGNYTRHYPAGVYNLFVRAAGGNGAHTESADITVVGGSAVISSPGAGASPYKFGVKGLGWQTYDFMPVTDSAGDLVRITFDGNPATLQVLQNQASDNMNFFMLMPTNVVIPSTVTLTNVSPDGSALYNPAGTFSFGAYSPAAPVDANNILVQVTATNLWLQGSVTSLSASSGLTVTGPSTNLSVSFPTTSNTIYTVFIQITDANGTPISSTVSFDTIVLPPVTPTANANYTFEAEDFDWGSGQYFDNPQTNAYNGFDGTAEIDFHATQHGGDYNRVGLTTESLNEKQRPQYNGTGKQDYDVGFNDGGNWGNYTRHYPAGTYNIWVRGSNGTGNTSADSGSISIVTSGVGTGSQTLSQLGKFSIPAIAWSTYGWYPIKDPVGNLAQFTGGSLQTLRMTIDGGNCNENFFLLTPANPDVVLQPYVDGFTPDSLALFQPSNTLTFVAHSQPGTATSNIGLNLNGVNVTGMTFSGTANSRNVSYPVQLNTYYTAIVTVTDTHGTATITNSFGTFISTNYQWECEDYNYGGGNFIDNPQLDGYSGFGSVSNIDNVQLDFNPNKPTQYRADNAPGAAPGTTTGDVNGELPRANFTSGGGTGIDYEIGYFNGWVNYTRHYPAGTYYVMGRFAEGNNPTEDTLSLVTGDVTTTNQTATLLGTFPIRALGWSTWGWSQLTDSNGKPMKVTLDGSATTLRLGSSPIVGHDEANAGFLMLAATTPSPKLTVTVSGGSIHISFPTQTGYSYQVQYKNSLADASWTSLGGAVSGNGAVQTVDDPTTIGSRFYRVQIQ